ncbi:DNA-binding MurR/RpiR family transcriptional regulator [Peribacillus deserti]|uniref:DNA-binding MurR/RpiR family transcriptional regulator n=1 Tax=Peribacillus deserti TaxID=673318 RepID=A0ABS2QI39_9BACI|nr:MurR/RpiR family transcriptional regulator [Peribacillus deserti]MBM7692799.1 DNA-binding MurR/RpiR family transcriptional regulator [Peribacillus deserti]
MKSILFEDVLKEKFESLSVGQKKVALYLSQHLEEAAFLTAFHIGRKAEVSETTVIRLTYALGYEGYSDMQAKIQQHLLQSTAFSKTNSKSHLISSDDTDVFSSIIKKQIHILKKLLDHLDSELIWKTADTLIKADQVLIGGYRASYAAACWFSHSLSMLRGNVALCSPAGDFYEKFSSLTPQSVVIVFSLPRYARESLEMAQCAKERGVKLISVTDRLLSPVGRMSDITLTTEEEAETAPNSIASAISLMELIIQGIYILDQKRVLAHQQKLEELYSKKGIFIE